MVARLFRKSSALGIGVRLTGAVILAPIALAVALVAVPVGIVRLLFTDDID